jgi:hypothetical protein
MVANGSLRKKPIFLNYHAFSIPLVCFKAYKISKYFDDQFEIEKTKILKSALWSFNWAKKNKTSWFSLFLRSFCKEGRMRVVESLAQIRSPDSHLPSILLSLFK